LALKRDSVPEKAHNWIIHNHKRKY